MAERGENRKHTALVLGPAWLTEMKSSSIKAFVTIDALIDYVVGEREPDDTLCLFIPGQHLKKLIDSNILSLTYVESVNSYYNSGMEFTQHSDLYRGGNAKLHRIMTTDLQMRLMDFFNARLGQVKTSSYESKPNASRTRRKKRSKTKNVVITNATAHFDPKCHKCSSIFQDPYQLQCGHRQCRSCVDKQKG